MRLNLHKCLVLVEATGLEGDIKFLKSFIYKGFRYSFPVVPQNITNVECRQDLFI